MRTIALTAAALIVAGAAAHAQDSRPNGDRSWYERAAQQRAASAPPIDNRRPPFAAHIGATGQGVE